MCYVDQILHHTLLTIQSLLVLLPDQPVIKESKALFIIHICFRGVEVGEQTLAGLIHSLTPRDSFHACAPELYTKQCEHDTA